MALLFPALNACRARMQPGERRLAERLTAKLPDDCLAWYDLPVGPANVHPDFIVLDPRRGALILEVKDWKPQTVARADKASCDIRVGEGLKVVANPLEQARQYAHAVVNVLKRDPVLLRDAGPHQLELAFPWAYGVALTHMTRQQFAGAGLDQVIEAHRVLCQDEMSEAEDAARFRDRLWGMFQHPCREPVAPAQVDRIRARLFPEIRIPPSQPSLFAEETDVVKVMDLQQEQLARSLGEGHRVIHGVAGSGKTLILAYRAAHLAPACAQPILVLCYNKALAAKLTHQMTARKLAGKVRVHSFHKWCRSQLVAHGVQPPPDSKDSDAWCKALVERMSQAVEKGTVPRGQYDAVLIDEGHDFEPEWLRLAVAMVNPKTNSLLVLFDDAQSIYAKDHKRKFSFKSVGIQAAGRTTILRVNYRNTQEILALASARARSLLEAKESDEDGVPVVAPIGAGRRGREPEVVRLPSLSAEAEFIARRLLAAHEAGTPWQGMAVIFRSERVGKSVLSVLTGKGIPASYQRQATFAADEDTVKFLTMHSCKGLEFPLVAIPGVGGLGRDEEEDTRLLYVAMTRATEELVVCDGAP